MKCFHFGQCGGCATVQAEDGTWAPLPYDQELVQKEEKVRNLLGALTIDEWRPMVPSPEIWNYRNKMEFAFGELREMSFRLGLREAGRFDRIVDLETCGLMSPEAVEGLKLTRAWAKKNALSGYNRFSHQGLLRYLVVREGKNTGQRMGFLIAAQPIEAAALTDLQRDLEPLFTTFSLGVTDARSDVARAPNMQPLWGPGTIEEKLRQITFRISPFSFFQTNTRGTERLYSLLVDWAKTIGGGALIDLYCGSGGITLSIAEGFDRVVGVDTNREAIADAQFNAVKNGIQNAEFVGEDALDFLKKLPGSKLSVQLAALIVDPPRPGLHPKAMNALVELNPPRLAYVSCNPESLARDLQILAPLYRIRSVQPVDLFPHTAHVETVVLLDHR
jgi:23S rRNA (uracil1939-C5)-methyltransferase